MLIIKHLALNIEGQILSWGTEWGQKNDKKRHFLPHKKQRMITKENTIFRFLSFLHSLTWILSFVVPFSWWSFFDRHSCFLISFLNLKSLLINNADFMLLLSSLFISCPSHNCSNHQQSSFRVHRFIFMLMPSMSSCVAHLLLQK